LIRQAFWLSLPVAVTGILHMVVVKAKLLEALKVPLDGGRTLGGERIFGDNKTWRGVVVMIAGSVAVGAIQGLLGGRWAEASGVECLPFARLGGGSHLAGYALVNLVHGIGYVVGELPNSFAKRRLSITPGKTGAGLAGAFFFLLDQADSVVAALVVGQLVFGFGWKLVLVGALCLTGLHLFINASLYFTKVRRNL
jgi:hypothetical protein